jgi:hypothetical protein
MNSPGLQQTTRCSRSHRIGSLLLVHPLSSDETRVSPLQKGDNVPKILLLTKYPYGLSFLLWPYRDVHTFPMRYVTVLACEHSCPLHLDLESGTQATGHSGYPHKFPQATGHSGYPHKTSQPKLASKQLDIPAIRTRVPKQLDTPAIRTRDLFSPSKEAKSHPKPINRSEESGRPGLCPVNPISSGLLFGTIRHTSRLHNPCYHQKNLRKITKQ